MKKIINGKKYDTETATKINLDGGFYDLYQKTNGEFFMYCKLGDSEELKPVTIDELKKFVEIHMNDQYEYIFGPCEE